MMLQNEDKAVADSAGSRGSLVSRCGKLLVQEWNVISALMWREMQTRFGRYKLGYLWALLEPLGYIAALSLLRMAFGRTAMAGLEFPIFFASGVIPFMVFNSTIMQSLPAVESNQGLFIYRRIRPYHTVVARLLLEFVINLVALLLILIGFKLGGFQFGLASNWGWGLLLLILFLNFCFGLSLMASIVGALFQESAKIAPILIRPLFLLSGVFIPAVAIPAEYLPWISANPVLQFIELIRYCFFEGYETPFRSLLYVAVTSVLALGLGLWVYRRHEVKVLTSGTIKLR